MLILDLAIIYLSIFGIKTNKFNNKITDSILKINNKINLSLKDVKYLLNPYNFTVDIKTKNPKISIEGTSITIKDIQTNVSLKSLIKDQFSIDYLQFETTKIKLVKKFIVTQGGEQEQMTMKLQSSVILFRINVIPKAIML